jgi:hypothetical protein
VSIRFHQFFQSLTTGVPVALCHAQIEHNSMFKIQRSMNGKLVVFALSGRIKAERLAELQKLLASEADDHDITLDLKEVKLVDRDVVSFLTSCETKRIKFVNCPAYIREWIERESVSSKGD